MNRYLRFGIAAPLAVAMTLMLIPAAQANNRDVCRAAQAGHARFTEDYRYFIRAFTAENSDNAEQWTIIMRYSLSRWRSRVLDTNASTEAGKRARRAVLVLIARSRAGVRLFDDAIDLQRSDLREAALETFTDGQQVLAEAAEHALPRLRAIGCGR